MPRAGGAATAVLFGGPSPEHDVSILTGLQALRALAEDGRDSLGIYWTKTGRFLTVPATAEAAAFLDGPPPAARELQLRAGDGGGFFEPGALGRARAVAIEAVLLCTHGGPGEDGTIQAALDLAGLPYSGPTVAGAALGLDKWAFGAAVGAAGLPTLPRVLFDAASDDPPFPPPFIMKPRFGGSSIGIDVVADVATARARLSANPHFALGCVLEPYRADLRDLQIALLTHPTLTLSAIERPLRRASAAEILDYRDKYVGGEGMVSAPRELPAELDAPMRATIERLATQVAAVATVRGVARLDFLAGGSELYVNELNTIPGSLSKYLFIEPALPFLELLDRLLDEARTRPAHRYSSVGADGLVLRSAAAIAAKLA